MFPLVNEIKNIKIYKKYFCIIMTNYSFYICLLGWLASSCWENPLMHICVSSTLTDIEPTFAFYCDYFLPDLFNPYSEAIIKGWGVWTGFIIGGYNLNYIRDENDTMLMANTERKLQECLDKAVKEIRGKSSHEERINKWWTQKIKILWKLTKKGKKTSESFEIPFA